MAHKVDTDGLCAASDLPPDQCAATRCRPDLRVETDEATAANLALLPSQIKRRTTARHVSIMGCGHHAYPGMTIALGPDGWVCAECDPGDAGAPENGDPWLKVGHMPEAGVKLT